MTKIKIAIIDDREDARGLVADSINDAISNLEITDEWETLSVAPLPALKNYINWVIDENIGVLIVDERLGEEPGSSGNTVDYKGSDLVEFLRIQNKEMLIYGVTTFPDDESLKDHFSLFNEVVKREIFIESASKYLDRFLRMYKNFLDINEKALSELSLLSRKIALGTATTEEKERAYAIQNSLEIPLMTTSINSRREWLNEYQNIISELKNTQEKAEAFLSNRNK